MKSPKRSSGGKVLKSGNVPHCPILPLICVLSPLATAIHAMCQPRNINLLQGFLMEMLWTWSGSRKMPDANLHTLGILHNLANYHI